MMTSCFACEQMVWNTLQNVETSYGADIESFKSDRLNGDEAEEFYSWNDGYIYYWTRIDKIQTLCRILPDGSGWEAVNWMFP